MNEHEPITEREKDAAEFGETIKFYFSLVASARGWSEQDVDLIVQECINNFKQ